MTTTTKSALIIVDVQNDFIDGSLPVANGDQAAIRISTVLDLDVYDEVVTTQDWHIEPEDHFSDDPDFKNTWPMHCKTGTRGAALSPRLDPIRDRIGARFFKGHYSAAYSGFEGTTVGGHTLAEYLRAKGVTEVDVVGIATDYCVKATAIDSAREGFKTAVLLPYTAAVSDDGLRAAIDEMREVGVSVPAWSES